MTKIVNTSFKHFVQGKGPDLNSIILTEEDHHVIVILDAVHDLTEILLVRVRALGFVATGG